MLDEEISFWRRESLEISAEITNLLKKKRYEAGSMYLALRFMLADLRLRHPKVYELEEKINETLNDEPAHQSHEDV